MSQVNINIERQTKTVSEMRRMLAQILSKLDGKQEISFSFQASLPEYTPAVVVDSDFDNRTAPGDVMEMRFPESVLRG